MRVEQDERFREERARYQLRFNCEDCVLHDPVRGCAHGYPTIRHHAATYDDPQAPVVLCKDFDLI